MEEILRVGATNPSSKDGLLQLHFLFSRSNRLQGPDWRQSLQLLVKQSLNYAKNKILRFAFFHVTQPLDVAVFVPLSCEPVKFKG